jgi:hypothetical protein
MAPMQPRASRMRAPDRTPCSKALLLQPCLGGPTMPRRSVQQRTGFRAETFVDKFVSDAGHIWNTTHRDFGIDGHIEFVEANEQVTGFASWRR